MVKLRETTVKDRGKYRSLITNPWIVLPIVLSVIFAVLFIPVARRSQGLPLALLYTLIGLCVIWASYFVRARIFRSWRRERGDSTEER